MNGNNISLSPRYGLNPTIPVCFWCGKERNEIALLGKMKGDVEAPRHMVVDFVPCEQCRSDMSHGFTLMEATDGPNDRAKVEVQKDVYPTGRFLVIRKEAALRAFGDISSDKAYVDAAYFSQLCPV